MPEKGHSTEVYFRSLSRGPSCTGQATLTCLGSRRDVRSKQLGRRTRPRIAQPTHTSSSVPPRSLLGERSRTRLLPLPPANHNRSPARESRATRSSAFPPLCREAQQMRPSSISCKPPAGWTPVPRDSPMPGGFILLGLSSLWPSSYFPVPEPLAGPGGSLGGRGLPPLLCGHPCSAPPGTRQGGWDGLQPPWPLPGWTQRSFIHIRSFLALRSVPSLPLLLLPPAVPQSTRSCRSCLPVYTRSSFLSS